MNNQFVRAIVMTAGVVLPAWIVGRAMWLGKRHRPNAMSPAGSFDMRREMLFLLGVSYAAAVIAIVIVPIPMTRMRNPAGIANTFVPVLHTIRRFQLALGPRRFMLKAELDNTLGNLILFIPAGILLPLSFARLRTWRNTALTALVVSTTIELAQLVSRSLGVFRSVDVDDVILNVSGACVGYLIYWMLTRPRS